MKRPAVFFDRDNTLIVGNDYLGDPAQVRLVPGAAAAVARARRLGYATVVVSNQSGVARGLFDENAVQAVNQRLDQLLLADDPAAVIDRHEYCPFHPEAAIEKYRQDSALRKPAPGMILQAAEKLALELSRSWVVGDAARDVLAGRAAGCRTILFNDPKLPVSPAAEENGSVTPDFTAASLAQVIDLIESAPEPAPMPPGTPFSPTSSGRIEISASDVAIAGALTAPVTVKPRATTEEGSRPEPTRPPADRTQASPGATKPAARALPNAAPPPTIRSSDVPRPATSPPTSTARMESLLDQMLTELRRRDLPDDEFSVSKLLAGVVQVLAIGVAFLAYLYRSEAAETFIGILLFANFLQALTIALLIMGRQR